MPIIIRSNTVPFEGLPGPVLRGFLPRGGAEREVRGLVPHPQPSQTDIYKLQGRQYFVKGLYWKRKI